MSDMAAAEALPALRKRRRPAEEATRHLRARTEAAEASAEADEAAPADVAAKLQEKREALRQRARAKGLDVLETLEGDAAREGEQNGEDEPREEQRALAVAFQKEENLSIEELQMRKFVEEELRRRQEARKRAAGDGKEQGAAAAEAAKDEDELYRVPAHLRVAERRSADAQETGDRWLAGISEVELPIEATLRALEETERAREKAAAMGPQGKRQAVPVAALPANFSADFARREAARARREQRQLGQRDPSRASDDAFARRFINKEKARRKW
jgi:hypothetical protein